MSHGFTIADIKRYVEGKMSPLEMHLIERAALEDPFLADAIEGMHFAQENYGAEKIDSDIAELKKNISASRARRSKIMYAAWWRAAAVLIVVVTAVAIVYFLNEPSAGKTTTVAKVERFKQDTPSPAPVAVEDKVEDSAPAVKNEATVASRAKRQAPIPKTKEFRYEPQNKMNDTSRIVSEQSALDETIVSAEADTTRRPVAAALQGRAAGIVINDKTKKEEADTSFAEVVVVGYGAAKKAAANGTSNKRITPEGGWKSFDEYINSNKRISGPDSLVTGAEEITFNIDEAGVPFDFRILRSLSDTHDKETIRLLKEGPTWNVEKGRRRLRLRIKF
jgi:hypothetical protein